MVEKPDSSQLQAAILADDQHCDRRGVRWAASSFGNGTVGLPGRYRSVYINQERIKAQHPRPIIVDDRQGLIIFCAGVTCHGKSQLVYSPQHEDGSCLWFETEHSLTLTDPEIES